MGGRDFRPGQRYLCVGGLRDGDWLSSDQPTANFSAVLHERVEKFIADVKRPWLAINANVLSETYQALCFQIAPGEFTFVWVPIQKAENFSFEEVLLGYVAKHAR